MSRFVGIPGMLSFRVDLNPKKYVKPWLFWAICGRAFEKSYPVASRPFLLYKRCFLVLVVVCR